MNILIFLNCKHSLILIFHLASQMLRTFEFKIFLTIDLSNTRWEIIPKCDAIELKRFLIMCFNFVNHEH